MTMCFSIIRAIFDRSRKRDRQREEEVRPQGKVHTADECLLLSGAKGNGTGPSAASVSQAFVPLVCFHWQHKVKEGCNTGRGERRRRTRARRQKNREMTFSCAVMIKLKRKHNREKGDV